jgi:ADP-heptose:LPS heptosyltransferase
VRRPERILICRTDNIGDVVLTLPLAGFLKQRLPGVKIDFLVRAYAEPVARHCRFVDRVLAIEEQDDLQRMLGEGAYDTVIFAYPSRSVAKAARSARVANRVGTSHRLFHWLTCNRLAHFSRVRSTLHEAQLNFALLRPLGIKHAPALDEIPAWYGLDAPQLAEVEALRAQAPFNLIVHPKSNGNGREWPVTHYEELARLLGRESGICLWLTGSVAEGALLAREAPALLALANVRNLCGRFDLSGLCALIGAADGLVASGTGPLHIAAAMGRPVLGLFPSIKPIDAARWGALGAQASSLSAPDDNMEAIGADMVAGVVLAWRHNKANLHAN